MRRRYRLRLLSYAVMAYMLLAFGWWSVLLHKKNKESYEARIELIKSRLLKNDPALTDESLLSVEEYILTGKKYKRQEYMILGEGLVFIISLLLGMWFIYRGYRKQIETSEEKRNFLLSITHELKSPLASLKIANETLSKRALNEDQQKMLVDNSQHDIDRLQKLVENLLLAAKVESNYEPAFDTINLTQEIKHCIDQLKSKYRNTQLTSSTLDEDIFVQADSTGLVSVIYNLIENAIKYSPKETAVLVDVLKDGDQIILKVADQGIGIPKEERIKVFNRFYRVGSEETRKTKGTGLGLYIVDRIAQVHNWEINISENSPQGTIIELFMPVSKQPI